MSAVFEFFQKIQKQILDLQNSIREFQESWDRFQKFWDLFFQIVPWEVLLLLVFSVILLSLFNSISPATPKTNLTVSILLLCGIWGYLWSLFSETPDYGKILWICLYILLPLHAFGLGKFAYEKIRKKILAKKRIKPRDWEESLSQVSKDYNGLMALAHSKADSAHENKLEILAKISDLEKSISGIKSLLQ
ncbi:hypothetical protein [Leptospira ilyithenensis]|uniref:Uncharacterized protein n=1 Tax=Leptospira ilyithenensis TaxID=2484901 RepID=A0A4R9LPJ3_9LEPT|nr:hypothetical protein [Leptospira ilyithenensis]TGN10931.1 hypothetical protein EHS11_07040 [Leptospira ilyithenensis]